MTGPILAAGASFAQIPAEHVQSGTFTCDISGGIGFIIGSQKALNCSFVPMLHGPPEFYSGVSNKLGIDLGGTKGGVMVWAVYAPTMRAAGFVAGTYADASAEVTVGGGIGANILVGGRAAAALGSGADRHQRRSRHRRNRAALRPLTLIHLSRRFFEQNWMSVFMVAISSSSDEIAYTLSTSEKMTPFTWPTPRRL
jgi:hypothetical protein